MTTVRTLEESPNLNQFIEAVHGTENRSRQVKAGAYDLELNPSGRLTVKGEGQGDFELSEEALRDLGQLAQIPTTYFIGCDSELQAISFNSRLGQKVPKGQRVCIEVRDETVIERVRNSNRLLAPRLPILNTIQNSMPTGLSADDARVVQHEWNGHFDLSVIAPSFRCEPRAGDVVAFGINVADGEDGAVQVQGSSFRCVCQNGAITRICSGRLHRIRRPVNRPERLQPFLQVVRGFISEAWRQWEESAEHLATLATTRMDADRNGDLRLRLRQAPFFLSAKVAQAVLDRLPRELSGDGQGPTLYDLWNSMSFLGTHSETISSTYRRRLRMGAGEFTRHRSSICKECRQLVVS